MNKNRILNHPELLFFSEKKLLTSFRHSQHIVVKGKKDTLRCSKKAKRRQIPALGPPTLISIVASEFLDENFLDSSVELFAVIMASHRENPS